MTPPSPEPRLIEPDPSLCVCGHGRLGHTTLGACEWCSCMDYEGGYEGDSDRDYDLWKDDVL